MCIEVGIAPLLGLTQATKLRLAERLALAGDHPLYGLVLSEISAALRPEAVRRRPQAWAAPALRDLFEILTL